ncbi:MAG: hypothetical protein ACI4NO_07945 [Oxalobacter sp.]
MTYGIYMHVSGFSFLYPALMSLTINTFPAPSSCFLENARYRQASNTLAKLCLPPSLGCRYPFTV